jgi:hypothetical protein
MPTLRIFIEKNVVKPAVMKSPLNCMYNVLEKKFQKK